VTELRELFSNLKAGLKLAFFLPVRSHDFYVSADQIVLLALVQLILFVLADIFLTGVPGKLELAELPGALMIVLLALLAGYVISRWQGDSWLALAFPVAVLSLAAFFAALYVLLFSLSVRYEHLQVDVIYFAVAFVVYARAALVLAGTRRFAANTGWLLILLVLPQILLPRAELWSDEESPVETDLPAITDETVFHSQPELLERSLSSLEDERPDITDLYFIGFAGDATLDVFMKELSFARDLFDSRFDTKGRSVLLINNRATLDEIPIASATHLVYAIDAVSKKMNRDQDILLVFMTSHGSESHELSVVLDPLELRPIDPEFLDEQLAAAGIKWRIVVVSACFSGGFVPPLADAKSLIITAADAEHPSFGCSPDADFTYFGRAFFAEQLPNTYSLIQAFENATVNISERERDKGYQASRPQLAMGPEMKAKLEEFEARLKVRTAASHAESQ
jgi:hypothetical protein